MTTQTEPLIDAYALEFPFVEEGEQGNDLAFMDTEVIVLPTPGEHPVYGGKSWGISYGGFSVIHWTVNYGARDAQSEVEVGKVLFENGTTLADDEVRWSIDVVDGKDAALLWRARAEVTAYLKERGFSGTDIVPMNAKRSGDSFVLSSYNAPAAAGILEITL